MKQIIEDLIKRYYELSLITTVLIPQKLGGAKSGAGTVRYHKIKQRAAKAWDVRDDTTGKYSDVAVEELIEKGEREKIAQLVLSLTESIIFGCNKQNELIPSLGKKFWPAEASGYKKDEKKHQEIMIFCQVRLILLGVISPFITQTMQPIYDTGGVFTGNKIVAEENKDSDEDSFDSEEGEV